jgi:antitoxin component YwqK of YwqJK toxin-antitoxin module
MRFERYDTNDMSGRQDTLDTGLLPCFFQSCMRSTLALKQPMKKQLILFCLISNLIIAQKTVTTYYDRQKTKKMEVYQADANGTRNGNYKNYDEDGALRNECNFKSGNRSGICVEYAKFPNYAGKMQIKTSETFANDSKEGLAIYYRYNPDLGGVYEYQKGYYRNNKMEGIWTQITALTDDIATATYEQKEKLQNEIRQNPLNKNSIGVKEPIKVVGGTQISFSDTTTKAYYFPSGKLRAITIWGKDGKIESNKLFYPDGKPIVEGYNYDGTPDADTQRAIDDKKIADEKEAHNIKICKENLNQFAEEASKIMNGKASEVIEKDYQLFRERSDDYNRIAQNKGDDFDKAVIFYKRYCSSCLDRMKGTPELKAANEAQEKLVGMKKGEGLLADSLKTNLNAFNKAFLGEQFVNEHNMNDYRYPKGRIIYDKASTLINSYSESIKSAGDRTQKQTAQRKLNVMLEKLLKISDADLSAMGKKLKKAATIDEIKNVFGVE